MGIISSWVLNRIIHEPAVLAVVAAVLANLDRAIKLLLKYFSAAQIDAAIDKGDAVLKAEVDKDAQKPV